MNEKDLLQQIADQNSEAFATLYRSLQPVMLRYAAGILAGDIEAAADAVDEAFAEVWAKASQYSGEGHAVGWIRRITRNKAIDWLRKRREKPFSSDEEMKAFSEQPDDRDTPDIEAEKASEAERLKRAMNDLTPDHYEVIWMVYYEDKSIKEMVEETGLASGTIKTRLFHARKNLEAILVKDN